MARSKHARRLAAKKTVEESAEEEAPVIISDRNIAAALVSADQDRDLKIADFHLSSYGVPLIAESDFIITHKTRYGLIGSLGSGKTTLLRAIAARELPMPSWMSIYFVDSEYPPTDESPLEAVIADANSEVERLEERIEKITFEDPESPELDDLFDKLDRLSPQTMEKTAERILRGLGFSHDDIHNKMTRELSGGWRMRVSLAKAMFIVPDLLLLDEPSAHLDMEATLFLENYLSTYPSSLIVTSHSTDFLDSVCNYIVLLAQKKLYYFKGDYSQFIITKSNLEEHQAKVYEKNARDVARVKAYVAKYGGTTRKLAQQAKSREKLLEKMLSKSVVRMVFSENNFDFRFPSPEKELPRPIIQLRDVAFGYPNSPILYRDVNVGIGPGDRIVIVGPNGAGKSTLVKLLMGDLHPVEGDLITHAKARIAHYHQHLAHELPLECSPVEYMAKTFPELSGNEQSLRQSVGRFGITGESQTAKMKTLSDGQLRLVALASLAQDGGNVYILDEPTNYCSQAAVSALADALSPENLACPVIMITHDWHFVEQIMADAGVNGSIWQVDDGKVVIHRAVDVMEFKEMEMERIMAKIDADNYD